MKEDKVYLQNILECILKIEKYTSNGEEDFMTSSLVQDGVIRNLEIIGEATKRLSGNFRDQNPDIPWREMAGLRDILIHNYMGVDLRTVWNVVVRELPRLKPQLEKLLT
ncbi:HepT-like ribonuclease domain-containing protein [Paradesulfitobacterium ferrireducens]|uniref:HepT-like ribonuclease domain-containing protein n=1 Tax=Paradesulfitobacterium ferrireducens TaxID=2816476 RepID=UPI001A90BB94|nr:HepT-like ribonuclease domain-containing protein [Paradesulfitobacterium ferrireducens]